eukprot:4628223-Pyramimonas_sp.AAC.1
MLPFSKGLFEHPGDVLPRPRQQGGIITHTPEGTEDVVDPGQVKGYICMDGSCTRHPIKELSRATWGYVQITQDARETCS